MVDFDKVNPKKYKLLPGVWEELEMVYRLLKGKDVGAWALRED